MKKLMVFIGLILLGVCQLGAAETVLYSNENMGERKALFEKYRKDGGKRIDYAGVLLFHEVYGERQNAAEDLCGFQPVSGEASLKDPMVLPLLIYALGNDPSWEVRKTIAECVYGFSNDSRIVEALKKSLQDRDDRVKMTAARSLLKLNSSNSDALNTLLTLFHGSRDSDTKLTAVAILPDSLPYKQQYVLKLFLDETSINKRWRIMSWLQKYAKENEILRDIILIVYLEFIKIIPGTPPENINLLNTEAVINTLAEILRNNPDYLVGNELVIRELREAVRIRKQDASENAKIGLNGMIRILEAVDVRNR